MPFLFELAAAEGWNPGVHDALAFYAADPEGFFVAEIDGERVGCIAAVRYATFGFIGCYLVKKGERGNGYGLALWNRALEHLDGLPIGLDAVAAQQENYKRSGFEPAHSSIRFQSDYREVRDRHASAVTIEPVYELSDELRAFDLAAFGAPRDAFLKAWIAPPTTSALIAREMLSGKLVGFVVGRECRDGTKIGPLFSTQLDVAVVLFDAVCAHTQSPWFLDVPVPNIPARALADERKMTKVFETARMWRGAAPQIALERVYGVTSFELG